MAVHMRPKDGRQLACYHSTLETSPIIGVMGIGESQYTYFKKKKMYCLSKHSLQKCES